MVITPRLLFIIILVVSLARPGFCADVVVGSKKFTESYVLGEIARISLNDAGLTVDHRQGIGATGIVWETLRSGSIQVYPEYTGTISEEILKSSRRLSFQDMRAALGKQGIGMTDSLGFNNTYALVMKQSLADDLKIKSITDLADHPDLRMSLSNEFLLRQDGWEPLKKRYGLAHNPKGIEHGLAYAAIAARQIDITDAYSTDAGIAEFDLVVLKDDLRFFPEYHAVYLYRLDLTESAVKALKSMAGTIDEEAMVRMNAEAEQTTNYTQAAALYFNKDRQAELRENIESYPERLWRWTKRHLYLVGISLLAAIAVGLPLGVVASRGGAMGQLILGTVGVIQTIPSLALLAFLVPVMGISPNTAILALFLYSLLPIVRNTASGLQSIPESLRESAEALGLEPLPRLRLVYLPMASMNILAGIKTSAVINVGTATIAALIGAGGLGEPIISGLSLNDNRTILEGAIPAALLALIVQAGFEVLDRVVVPRGLRLKY